MRIHVLTVGRPRDRSLVQQCETYIRRSGPAFRVEWDAVQAGDPRGSQIPARAMAAEGKRLLKRIDPRALIVALDDRGKARSSPELARWLGSLRDESRTLQLIVGGAFGLAPEVRQRCTQRLSLSPMTLPHELALLVLLEQLYRAKTLLMGEPYHH